MRRLSAFVAGLMRGFSGFGAALTIAPVLAVAVGPRAAIPAILFLMLATSAQLAPRAIRDVNWPTVVPLSVGGVIGILIGAWLLIVVDQGLVRKSISITVIFFSFLHAASHQPSALIFTGFINPLKKCDDFRNYAFEKINHSLIIARSSLALQEKVKMEPPVGFEPTTC